MARTRNIKPGFFKNEDLAELGPHAMLLFAGLWTLADREGRLEDRPKRIKAEVFPYFKVHTNALLDLLASHGFIERYEFNGDKYIGIPSWHKHQNPHVKECASTIPAPCEHHASPVLVPEIPERAGPSTLTLNSSLLIPSTNSVREFPRREESPPSPRFEDWWAIWSARRGTNHRPQAENAYFRLVTVSNEGECFVCTESYLASLEGNKGYNPENFLDEQARDGFRARWPARAAPKRESRTAMLERIAAEGNQEGVNA